MKVFRQINDVRALRKKIGLKQVEFWAQVGMTQPGGCRYESGQKIPKPVCALLYLVYIRKFNSKILNFNPIKDVRTLREKLRVSQTEFWTKVGISQTGGSRYESGRRMPKPISALLHLVYIQGLNLETLDFH